MGRAAAEAGEGRKRETKNYNLSFERGRRAKVLVFLNKAKKSEIYLFLVLIKIEK